MSSDCWLGRTEGRDHYTGESSPEVTDSLTAVLLE
jgi:hypothetical protein